ncbi:LLM class flavin-dependent oxidoreductase [Micromonospora sp. NPDC048830]|uniref:LLM class flavin-dependent oxidoreductase n=1 Tax=Micromonospora sp. NPDC048830 TaxID=3364257 RepID=UPI003714BE37
MYGLPRLGLHIANHGSAASALRLAKKAEQAGVNSIWLSEDLFYRGAFSLAGAVAAHTERAQIGFGVIAPQLRHPAALAMEVRSLLDLAGDRVLLGIGAGVNERVAKLGFDSLPPVATVRHSVDAVRALLRGVELDQDGPPHVSRGLTLTGEPPSKLPPFYVAAVGPKALAQAGATMDGVILSIMCSRSQAAWSTEAVRTAAKQAGREEPPPVVAYLPMAVDTDGDRARARMKDLLIYFIARWAEVAFLSALFTDWSDMDREQLRRVAELVRRGEDARPLIPDEMVDEYCVAGTREDCARSLLRFAEAGISVAAIDAGADPAHHDDVLDALASLCGNA